MRSSHWMARKLLEQAGFRWELRRAGDLKLGLWRKKFNPQGPAPLVALKRVVFLPGFGDTSLSWLGIISALMPLLKKDYDELVLFEFPGFLGPLSKDKPFESMEHLSTRVYEILDTLTPRTLIGHSLGGWLAALYTVECGSGKRLMKVSPRQLILINPGGVAEDFADSQKLRMSLHEVFEDQENGTQRWRKLIFGKEPFWFPMFAPEIKAFLTRPETRAFVQSFGDEYLLMERLMHVDSEVRFIWGELDSLFPPELAQHWMKHLVSKRTEQNLSAPFALVIRGVGHSPHLESAIKTTAALARVLKNSNEKQLHSRWWRVVSAPKFPQKLPETTST